MSSQARPAGWQSSQLPASCARQAGDEAPKAAVFAANLPGTVGGKALKSSCAPSSLATAATSPTRSDRDLSAEAAGLGMLVMPLGLRTYRLSRTGEEAPASAARPVPGAGHACPGVRSDPQPDQFAVKGPAVRRDSVGRD